MQYAKCWKGNNNFLKNTENWNLVTVPILMNL